MKTPQQHHCPTCGSMRVHRSHRRGMLEYVVHLLGAEVRRCHSCRNRQAWLGRVAISLGNAERECWRRLAFLGTGFAVCLMVVWWMITRFTQLSG